MLVFYSSAEPVGAEVFLAGAWADLKFELEQDLIFGSAPAPFFASEKRNDLKMFIVHCILFIFLYKKIINTGSRYGTCWIYVPTAKYKTRYIFWDGVKQFFLKFFSVLGQNLGLLQFYIQKYIFQTYYRISKFVFWSRSRSKPSFYRWSRSRKKISGAGAKEKWLGSAAMVIVKY